MAHPDRPPSLDQLDAKLRAAQAKRDKRLAGRGGKMDDAGRTARGQGIGLALRIGTELVAGLAVGVGIGLGLDWWLETKPWFMIVFFVLGAAAGLINVYRTMSHMGHAVGYADNSKTGRNVADSAESDGKNKGG